jgi:hypothetical protein
MYGMFETGRDADATSLLVASLLIALTAVAVANRLTREPR